MITDADVRDAGDDMLIFLARAVLALTREQTDDHNLCDELETKMLLFEKFVRQRRNER